jgi:HNH endonuclease
MCCLISKIAEPDECYQHPPAPSYRLLGASMHENSTPIARDEQARTAQRFWTKVSKPDNPNGCWLWTGCINKRRRGYGQFRLRGQLVSAHRAAWILTHGNVAAELDVCHRCDNPSCVRPDHLFVGTRGDNMRDCANKNRLHAQQHPEAFKWGPEHEFYRRPEAWPRGEKVYGAKLTAANVREIRQRRARGASLNSLASEYGVSFANISLIARRKTWRHIQ